MAHQQMYSNRLYSNKILFIKASGGENWAQFSNSYLWRRNWKKMRCVNDCMELLTRPDQTTRLRTMYERQIYFIFFKLPCLSNLAYPLRSVIWLFPTSTNEQALHSVLRSTSRLKAESFSWAPAISDELIAFYVSQEGSKLFLPLHPFYLRKIH